MDFKQIISILLAGCMGLSLAACAGSEVGGEAC